MATITINGQTGVNNLVSFGTVPLILKASQPQAGTKASLVMRFSGGQPGQAGLSITVNGESVTSVESGASGRNFTIGQTVSSTAWSVMKALRQCPRLSAAYDIVMPDVTAGAINITARQYGPAFNLTASTDFSPSQLTFTYTGGTMAGGPDRYTVDVYKGDAYRTSLVKVPVGSDCRFDLQPVVSTFPGYGEMARWKADIVSETAGEPSLEGEYTGWSIRGYALEDAPMDWLSGGSTVHYAQANIKRYIGYNKLDFSIINFGTTANWNAIVYYSDESRTAFSTETISFTSQMGGYGTLSDVSIDLNADALERSSIVFIATAAGSMTYSTVKPQDASGTRKRLYWRNERGGVSFFDFTADIENGTEMSETAYTPTRLDWYERELRYGNKTYRKKVDEVRTLHAHLIDTDGLPLFRSLSRSGLVWDDNSRVVKVTSLNIDPEDGSRQVYGIEAEIKYEDLNR